MPRSPHSLRGLSLALPLLLGPLLLGTVALANELNKPLPTFRAKDEAGAERALSAYRGQVVVIVAWSSRGPSSAAYTARLKALAKQYAPKAGRKAKVVILGLASNHFETRAGIKSAKDKIKLPFPILLDPGGAIARKIKTFSTPTALVIDREGILRYRGAIDDDPRGKKRTRKRYLHKAILAVLAGRTPSPNKTKVTGFRIRFK
ncbi:MAG: redoxin domain-containing protein [Planctomycetes bacterium]|nr:redoxin domain-containing protein [Planctomycetota bacterium]